MSPVSSDVWACHSTQMEEGDESVGSRMPQLWVSCRYVDEEGVVTLKGRVAASIQSSDELVLTELIFNSGFKATPCRDLQCIYAAHDALHA